MTGIGHDEWSSGGEGGVLGLEAVDRCVTKSYRVKLLAERIEEWEALLGLHDGAKNMYNSCNLVDYCPHR